MITFHIITIFPEALAPYFKISLLGRAQKKKLIKINLVDLKKFAKGKYKSVDDKPFGGGPGMVIKIEPVYRAVSSVFSVQAGKRQVLRKFKIKKGKSKIILFSTRGKKLDQKTARRLSKYEHIVLICGRYEGVDERVAEHIADQEISIGDYILFGGEVPAMALVEAVSRHVPGVLGKTESLEEKKGSYPVYTRPADFKGWKVPKVLTSGNHKAIEKWRKQFFEPNLAE